VQFAAFDHPERLAVHEHVLGFVAEGRWSGSGCSV
jgi:hypothetical protein